MNNIDKFIEDRNDGTIRRDEIWERYFDKKHPKHQYVITRFAWMISKITGEKVLDIGCSNGLGIYLASRLPHTKELCGIDVCHESVEQSQINNQECPANFGKLIRFQQGMAEALEYPKDYFDTVMMGEVLEHVLDAQKALKEAHRVLKKGGTLIVSVPEGGNTSADHLRTFTELTLWATITKAWFKADKIEKLLSGHKSSPYWLMVKATKI